VSTRTGDVSREVAEASIRRATPETRAMLAACRRGLGQAEVRVPTGFDPTAVAALAAAHAFPGLVHRGWTELALDGVPGAQEALSALHAVALSAVAVNLCRIRELHRAVQLFEGAGIPVLVLKGPALAVQAYGDPHERSYGDVDLLVEPVQAEAAIDVLLRAGYLDRREGRLGRPSSERWHDWGFTAPDGETLVELHWGLARPSTYPALAANDLWNRSVELEILGRTVRGPRPEPLLPYLCVHGARHAWGWFEAPASIAGLLGRSAGLDWDEVLDVAERWRVRRTLATGLRLTEDLFGARPPDLVRDALYADPSVPRLAGAFRELMLHGTGAWHTGSPRLWWLQVRLRDRWSEGLAAGRGMLLAPSPTEWGDGSDASRMDRLGSVLRRVRRLAGAYLGRRREVNG
jgi:hypothetical protein